MRRRILLLVVGVITLVLLAAAIPLAVLVRSNVAQRSQKDLLSRANDVARFLSNGSPDTAEIRSYLALLDTSILTSVTLPNGTSLGSSLPASALATATGSPHLPTGASASPSALPTTSSTPQSATNAPVSSSGAPPTWDGDHGNDYNGIGDGHQRLDKGVGGGGFGDGQQADIHPTSGGQLATASVATTSGTYLVRAYQSNSQRYSGVYGWWAIMAGTGVTLVLVGAATAELFTRRIVRPLTDAAATANRIASGDITARARTDGPRETAAVAIALNSLADRIDTLIAEERETVADLSHRLRTPLTALRLDAESLSNQNEAERISDDVANVERTLTAVIRAARRPQREGRIPATDLSTVVAERVEFWSALAEDQGRQASVRNAHGPLSVKASAEDLGAAVDALLENVIAHTPEGSPFWVEVDADESLAHVIISDAGPGLNEEATIRGRSDRGSSGLGLDIARQVAHAAGGEMRIGTSSAGGAEITLFLQRVTRIADV